MKIEFKIYEKISVFNILRTLKCQWHYFIFSFMYDYFLYKYCGVVFCLTWTRTFGWHEISAWTVNANIFHHENTPMLYTKNFVSAIFIIFIMKCLTFGELVLKPMLMNISTFLFSFFSYC